MTGNAPSNDGAHPKPLSCCLCDKGFRKYEGLAWHRRSVHRTVIPQPGGGLPPVAGGANDDAACAAPAGRVVGGGSSRTPPPALQLQPPLRPPPPPPPPPLSPTRLAGGSGGGDGGDGWPPSGDAPPSPPPPPPQQPSIGGASVHAQAGRSGHVFDFEDNAVDDALSRLDTIIADTRRPRKSAASARKKRRVANDNAQPTHAGYEYATVAAEVRQHYEDQKDWESTVPLVKLRKGCRPRCFNSYRLRQVERFFLECGGGGLSISDQEKLYDVLDAWDRTKPGMPVDDGHFLGIRDTFQSKTSFKNALKDDIDDAADDEGWLTADLEEGGETYQTSFRPALELGLRRLRDARKVKLWSGGSRPAPPTNRREGPMDGDAFRQCEAEAIKETDENSFVLGFHGFSDASRLSSSGGKLARWVGERGWKKIRRRDTRLC